MSQEGQTTGNKRKRTALDTTQDVGVKLKSKLHHGVIEVRRAVKKVKGQELQKCVKRLKNVREKEPPPFDISQLDAELNYLKALDVELFGDTALYSKLKKDKVLSSNEHFIDVLASELSGSLVAPAKPGSPEAKVDARLLSSKALASEVSTVLTSLRSIINPPPRVQRPNEVEDPEQDGPAHPKKTAKVLTAFSTEDGIDEEEASGDVSDRLVPEEEDDEVDDGGWESGSVNSEDEGVSEDEDGVSRGNYDEERDDSDDEFPPPKKSKLAAAGSKVATRPIGGSTFLPSLSVGFTRGDSDSEPEDVDDDGCKKNRRGQRARRA
ncbi:hypothetical protein EUX98_g2717 [Antrodiella citrinella]|uniref:Bud22 domain-containing protein n=1 Tax=Antrodiella citrinella TaxID=2447956 RepID=A0A4S4MYB0_9APHY|nr:hypothetical protein EUX98_g2717 [Antrodiella citrinella]